MVVIPEITTRMFYIIIAVIGAIGLLVAIIQIWRIRKGNKNVKFLAEQAKQRKIDLVKMDLKSNGRLSNLGIAGKTKNPKKAKTQNMVEDSVFPLEDVRERLNKLESTMEYQKVQELIMDIESKKMEFEKKEKKFEINESDYRKRLSKFNGGK
jgi:hypothetical protein